MAKGEWKLKRQASLVQLSVDIGPEVEYTLLNKKTYGNIVVQFPLSPTIFKRPHFCIGTIPSSSKLICNILL